MQPQFTVYAHVSRPIEQVYEAIADPAQLSAYFTTGGARGRLQAGATVWWDFADFPGAFPVEVVDAAAPHRIVLRWDSNEAASEDGAKPRTTVTFALTGTGDGRTRVEIAETGWRADAAGLQASYGNCMGWSQMLCALKAWLEHGVNLREGMY